MKKPIQFVIAILAFALFGCGVQGEGSSDLAEPIQESAVRELEKDIGRTPVLEEDERGALQCAVNYFGSNRQHCSIWCVVGDVIIRECEAFSDSGVQAYCNAEDRECGVNPVL